VVLLGGAASFASPAVAVSPDSGGPAVDAENLSLWERGQKAREYKGQYDKLKDAYEDSWRQYEEARTELPRVREAILLHRDNKEDFQTLAEMERKAWGRLYGRFPGGEGRSRQAAPDAGDGDKWFPPPSPEEWREDSADSFIYRWLSRYRFWKNRLDRIQEAYERLEETRAAWEAELQRAREELEEMGGATADARNLFEREMDIWRRIYALEDK
jgi:chromosome segregation ATPase